MDGKAKELLPRPHFLVDGKIVTPYTAFWRLDNPDGSHQLVPADSEEGMIITQLAEIALDSFSFDLAKALQTYTVERTVDQASLWLLHERPQIRTWNL